MDSQQVEEGLPDLHRGFGCGHVAGVCGIVSLGRRSCSHLFLTSCLSDDLPVLVSGAQQLALRGEANQLIKQCFSIVWNPTSEERTHWHLIAYYSVASRAILPRFQTGNIPCILPIVVTAGQYMSYKKFKADQRHYRTKQFSHKTSSGHATTKQSEAPPRRDRLAASSLSPSCSSERTSLSLSLTYVNPQCNRSGETPPRDSSQSWSPKSQLLPLLHLCSLNTIHHRSEVDRRHIAALDGCRLSISMLPSSHTTPTLPLPPMSRMREYDFV